MNILDEIIAKKRERLEESKRRVPREQLLLRAFEVRQQSQRLSFRAALQRDGINIIAEFKRRSPSKGVIRAGAELGSIVRSYEAGGAAALSVLTEEDYFDGSLDDLGTATEAVVLPVLRKDFVFDDYQVYEASAAGASAVLLIVAALQDRELRSLRGLAEDELGMETLVEVHNEEEMKRAAQCGAKLIGVNNRDLRTFEVSLDTSLRLASLAPRDALLVSESGLNEAADLRRLSEQGFHGFLIGESLMRASDPEQTLRDLRS